MLFQMANYIVEMGVANLTKTALLEEARRTAALQTALQEAQLRMLESQINPHFMFNALGLISYTALREKAPQTEEISYCLSDLLRYSLRSHDTPATLCQELEAVQRYLAIQQMRFGNRLNVQLEVEEQVRNRRIPVMLLQPLVENAVVHGVEPLTRPVTVAIRAAALPDGLQLEVRDDGPGMAPGMVENLGQHRFDLHPGRHTVGLPNVIRRLELEYGPKGKIQIVSQPGHGTQVTVFIPAT
jgi:sensor histidine kinase YesM